MVNDTPIERNGVTRMEVQRIGVNRMNEYSEIGKNNRENENRGMTEGISTSGKCNMLLTRIRRKKIIIVIAA